MEARELMVRRRSIEAARADGHALEPSIAASWSRCRPTLDVRRSAAPVDAEPDEVRARWEASPIRRSGVGLEEQLASAADAGDLVAAVTDEQGRILWSAGGRTMRGVAESVGFVPGGRWDEQSAGTNALGLALLTRRPATVFSAEHWCEAVHDWVCWSVPVCDAAGRAVGVIDLSGRWDTATPLAGTAVRALGRLVEEHLPVDPGATSPLLELHLLGRPSATLGGRPLALALRQIELLAALAIIGPCSLAELQVLVYGDRPVSPATIKAELSHLRHHLGGAIGSRPYRLTLPVRVDALELRKRLAASDVAAAALAYVGQLVPASEAPFLIDERYVLDVSLRRALLVSGAPDALLAYADVHPYDVEVLERVVASVSFDDPRRHEAIARIDVASA